MRLVFPAESPQLGETLRRRRLERGLALEDAARELGVPARTLRALEWDRRDLLAGSADVERIERRYRVFLGVEVDDVAPPPTETPPPRRLARRDVWIALLAGLVPLLVIALAYLFQEATAGGDSESGQQLEATPTLSLTLTTPGARGAAATAEKGGASPGERATKLVVTAGGGNSWVEARAGSRAGPVLFRGTLTRGRNLRLAAAERIWLRLGAASNVSLAVNGRPASTDLYGTLDVLVTPKGIRPD
jgi:transcriptional regulator with XRE-family HTH domain